MSTNPIPNPFDSLNLDDIEPEVPPAVATPGQERRIADLAARQGFVTTSSVETPLPAARRLGSKRNMMTRTIRIQVRDFNIMQTYCEENGLFFWQAFEIAAKSLIKTPRGTQRS